MRITALEIARSLGAKRTITATITTTTTRRTFALSAAMGKSRMQRWFPGTAHPLIVSAPMAFVTNPKLASEVVRANGLGFIQGGRTFKPDSSDVLKLDEQLTQVKSLLSPIPPSSSSSSSSSPPPPPSDNTGGNSNDITDLPVGVGFVLFSDCAASHFAETTAPILARHRPVAVWLFAPDPDRPETLLRVVDALRRPSTDINDVAWNPRIVVQVGTVAAARQAAGLGVDVIVAQGVDAGGHQFAQGAGIVSLVPEIRDLIRDEFPDKEISVWAAGGIADGRGVVAALALGAEAAVLGTRYMVAPESDAEDYKREAILSASDGAANTVKSRVHDHVQGNRSWPAHYDGRALVHPSYHNDLAGVAIEKNEARYKAAKERGDTSMMVTWSGSGVGLIRSALSAAEVTMQVREEAVAIIEGLKVTV